MASILHVKSVGRTVGVVALCLGVLAATSGASAANVTAESVTADTATARTPAGPVAGGMGGSRMRPSGVSPQGSPNISLTHLVGGLDRPLYVTHAGDGRLFVVEQAGRIRIVRDDGGDWRIGATFLDIRGRVGDAAGEQGLLGLAFHPDYGANGRFYVNYTNEQGDTIIAEFRRRTKNHADPDSFRKLMEIHQPFDNHNGGWVGFKGSDLYIATGDGGSAGDPGERAQDLGSRLGKILRIDPLDPAGPDDYRVPSSNPFVGRPGKDVIWSYGLRNPWRVSFDRLTGQMWIGDVGQERFEEIDRHATGSGKNFGWDRLEGTHRYPSGVECQSNCKTLPVFEYRHQASGPDNCSVTGGYVSRRSGAALYGRYLLADLCSQRIWAIDADHQLGDSPVAKVVTDRTVSSFGEDRDGRMYLTDLNGSLWRVDGT